MLNEEQKLRNTFSAQNCKLITKHSLFNSISIPIQFFILLNGFLSMSHTINWDKWSRENGRKFQGTANKAACTECRKMCVKRGEKSSRQKNRNKKNFLLSSCTIKLPANCASLENGSLKFFKKLFSFEENQKLFASWCGRRNESQQKEKSIKARRENESRSD